jgi:hypothetical protein
MRLPIHAGALMLALAGCLPAVAQEPDGLALQAKPATPAAPKEKSVLDKATIQAAVRAVLEEQPAIPRLHEADTLRANQYDKFARQVEEATVPDCLHSEGLKRQPTFFLGGLLALPFIAVAKVRGKCQ